MESLSTYPRLTRLSCAYQSWPAVQCATNDVSGLLEFFSEEFEPRRTHPRVAHPNLCLHQFDELNKIGNSIHSQQRQEPAVQFESFVILPTQAQLEQFH